MPENAAVFNDLASTGGLLFEALAPSTRGTDYVGRGQVIGWGMGATIGVKSGSPTRILLWTFCIPSTLQPRLKPVG